MSNPLLRTPARRGQAGFSLVELLAVMGIIAILGALTIPALSVLNGRRFDGSLDQITAMLNLAREDARSDNTYTWVFFFFSNVGGNPQLTLVPIESKDGTDPINWVNPYPNVVPDDELVFLARPLVVPQVALAAAGAFSSQISSLPAPAATTDNALNTQIVIQVSLPILGTVPSGSYSPGVLPAAGTTVFAGAIRYLPSVGAGNNIALTPADPNAKFIELDLQPMHGSKLDAKNVAVIRVDKASAALQVYRP